MNGSAVTWISCIVILLIFWLLLIRPQRKKEKQVAAMRKSIKAGDKIVTIGGIKGRVIKDKEDSLIIEAGDRVRMEVMRWAVSSILEEGRGSVRKEAKKEATEEIAAPAEAPEEKAAEEAVAPAEQAPAEAAAEEASEEKDAE